MMRVLHITHYGELYGANRSLLDLVLRAREAHGVEAFVLLGRDGALRERLEQAGISCAVVPFKPWMERRIYMGGPHHRLMQWTRHRRAMAQRAHFNRQALQDMLHRVAEWRPELLHVHSSVIGLGPELARRLQVPWVWHIRELHRQHYGYSVDGGEAAFGRALRKADAVIALSEAVRRDVLELGGKRVRVHVIPNGIAHADQLLHLRRQAEQRWEHPRPFRFALLGLFHPSKGQVEAVEALAAVRAAGVDVELVLAGDGPAEAIERSIAATSMQAHVQRAGFVEDPFALYHTVHCVLNCSRHEAMGRTTVEAMASGLPVIGHASGATVELIDPGQFGALYRSPEELAAHMRQLATHPDEARRMGRAAMDAMALLAQVEGMCAATLRVYCQLLQRPPASVLLP